MMFDSIDLMKEVRYSGAYLPGLDLESCCDYFFWDDHDQDGYHHDAYHVAKDCRRICEEASHELGYESLLEFIEENDDWLKSFRDVWI